jgi:hypothetical protein
MIVIEVGARGSESYEITKSIPIQFKILITRIFFRIKRSKNFLIDL